MNLINLIKDDGNKTAEHFGQDTAKAIGQVSSKHPGY